jgi:hypothetical protein
MRGAVKAFCLAGALALMAAMIGLGYADAPSYPHSNAGN